MQPGRLLISFLLIFAFGSTSFACCCPSKNAEDLASKADQSSCHQTEATQQSHKHEAASKDSRAFAGVAKLCKMDRCFSKASFVFREVSPSHKSVLSPVAPALLSYEVATSYASRLGHQTIGYRGPPHQPSNWQAFYSVFII